MKNIKYKFLFVLLFLVNILFVFLMNSEVVNAKNNITLTGKIISTATNKPVEFGILFIKELNIKSFTDINGNYKINIKKPGEYTLIVTVEGFKKVEEKKKFTKSINQDYFMDPISLHASAITLRSNRFIQKVSRKTMTRDEIKATPGACGDALIALTSMPGIDQAEGFFGPLVIRGMDENANRYYVDGMPINSPMHFGGLHSVINTNIIDTIDNYQSSFPVQYGGALAGVIEFNTVDSVKKTGGYADVSIISTNFLMQTPILTTSVNEEGNETEENTGYFIASGRYGYLGLIVPYIYEKTTGNKPKLVPEYYDYQAKFKKFINHNHFFTMLFIGSKDKFKFFTDSNDSSDDNGGDPLGNDIKLRSDEKFNNLGVYYTFEHGRLKNKLMTYGSLTEYSDYLDNNQKNRESIPDWMKDLESSSKPNIYGVKNTTEIEWIKNHADLKLNAEYSYYDFKSSGNSLQSTTADGEKEGQEPLVKLPIDDKIKNHLFTGYLENRFVYSGLTFVPGVRSDYLKRLEKATFDPRAMISYEFDTQTTISLAGGKYSSFVQLNPFLFTTRPDICKLDYIDPEKAYHSVVGIEQKFGLFTIGMESYYNYFTNMAMEYPHIKDGKEYKTTSSGKNKIYGFEFMLKKDKRKNSNGFFGWVSYSFNKSKHKSGITGNIIEDGVDTGIRYDSSGHKWINYDYDRRHAVKLVAGYTYGNHTLSGKFQYYTSLPYTGINDSFEDPNYAGRHVPIMDDSNKNERRYPPQHWLELRYSYRSNYSWGYVSWYIEVMNVYANRDVYDQWRYDRPYSNNNPKRVKEEGLVVIPNFGVEVKF